MSVRDVGNERENSALLSSVSQSLPGDSEDYTEEEEEEEEDGPSFLDAHRWKLSFAIVAIWFLAGVVISVQVEGWDYATALYVVVQIVTTVGYGDHTVNPEYHVFMICYILIGIPIVSNIISDMAEVVSQAAYQRDVQVTRAALQLLARTSPGLGEIAGELSKKSKTASGLRSDFHHAHRVALAAGYLGFFTLTWAAFFSYWEPCSCGYDHHAIEGCVDSSMSACMDTGGKLKNFREGLYFAIVTFSTVGFGDFLPMTKEGRYFAIVWMLLGVTSFGNFIAATVSYWTYLKQSVRKPKKLTMALFQNLDENGNNVVTRTEFRNYFLVRQGLVNEEDLFYIDQAFDRMDTNRNGSLEIDEIEQLFGSQLGRSRSPPGSISPSMALRKQRSRTLL